MSSAVRFCAGLALLLALCSSVFADDETRVWSDASGSFTIRAKYVSEKDGKVTLVQEDGEEVEIALKELSESDQKFVANLKKKEAASPFKAKKPSPFAPKSNGKPSMKKPSAGKPSKSENSDDEEDAGNFIGTEAITVNWQSVETISAFSANGEWSIETERPSSVGDEKRKNVNLPPKTDFHERLEALAVSPDGRKAVFGYHLARHGQGVGTTRVCIGDFETGKASAPCVVETSMIPLALHPDGEHVLMRREEFGFGNHDRLEIWRINGKKVQKKAVVTPYGHLNGPEKDILSAEFIDAERFVTLAGRGELAVWSFPAMQPEFQMNISGASNFAISPNRKLLAYCDGKSIGLLDLDKREIAATKSVPAQIHNALVAFSPSGSQLAFGNSGQLFVCKTADGEVVKELSLVGINGWAALSFPDEDFLLINNLCVVEIANQIKLWSYEGQERTATSGPWVIFGVTDGQKAGVAAPAKVPHPQALQMLKKVESDPNLFVLRPGTKVKIDASGIGDAAQREKVVKDLADRLTAVGCSASETGSITLTATVTGPKPHKISFRRAGDFDTQEYVSSVKFVFEGKTLWENTRSNVSSVYIVTLKEGENIATWLKEREKPDYAMFSQVDLPKYLQKPNTGSAGPQNTQTLGQSRVTTGGLR